MIALYIILGVFAFFTLILFLSVTVKISFKEDFVVAVKFAGIKVFEFNTSEPETKKEIKTAENTKGAENKEPNVFEQLKQRYGFTKTVQILFSFVEKLLTHIKKLLRHIKINKVILNLSVATDDAASTAIEYGVVCSAVYPVLALISSVAEIKYKQINVSADFNSKKPQFDFKLNVTSRVIFLLIAALKAFMEYKNFTEEYINERK